MKILYGNKDSLKDVTKIAIDKFKNGNYILIPANRIKRKYAFGKVSGEQIIKVIYDDNSEEIFDNNKPVVLSLEDMYSDENVAFLIPMTSKGNSWEKIEDSFFNKYFINTFKKYFPKNMKYTFYLGVDWDEKIYTKENLINLLKNNLNNFNYELDVTIYKDIRKGFLTRLWNILYHKAYNKKIHNYYYQCGDDIVFYNNWIYAAISKLKENKDIGISGPLTLKINKLIRDDILTQVLLTNKHMEIFGNLFSEKFDNVYCDDWLNYIYINEYFYPLNNQYFYILNNGGNPRYKIIVNSDINIFLKKEVKKDKLKLINYIKK